MTDTKEREIEKALNKFFSRLKEIEERWNDPEMPVYTKSTIPDLLRICKEQQETIARLEESIKKLQLKLLDTIP